MDKETKAKHLGSLKAQTEWQIILLETRIAFEKEELKSEKDKETKARKNMEIDAKQLKLDESNRFLDFING